MEQLCSAAGRGTGRLEPLRVRRPAACRGLGTPGGSLDVRRPTRHSQARGGRGKAEGPREGGGGRGPAMTSAEVVVNHGWVVSPCKLKKKGRRWCAGCFCYSQIFLRFELASAPLPVLPKPGPWKPIRSLSGRQDSCSASLLTHWNRAMNDSSLPVGFATSGFQNHSFSSLL